MEFLRFGSSIPGSYWGCCAVCIIQNFNFDADAPYSIELVEGDGGNPLKGPKGFAYLGKTYREVFLQRLRIGTFGTDDMPNHTFFAVLTNSQISGGYGKQWLSILKEQGFEFVRTVDNSVYTGDKLIGEDERSPHPNHIFALFRNIGAGAIEDPYEPPAAWSELPGPTGSPTDSWNALPPKTFYTEAELDALGVPVHLAGRRSSKPQRPRPASEKKEVAVNPFGGAQPVVPV